MNGSARWIDSNFRLHIWIVGSNVKGVERIPDPMVSTEEEVDVDAETAAAIDRGIRAVEEGRVVPSEEVRKLVCQWISNFSTPGQYQPSQARGYFGNTGKCPIQSAALRIREHSTVVWLWALSSGWLRFCGSMIPHLRRANNGLLCLHQPSTMQ